MADSLVLACSFFADLILYVFLSKAKDVLVINVVIGVISLIIGCLFCWQDITMIMNLTVVPIAIFYLSLGYGMKKALNVNDFSHRGKVGICLLALGLVIMMTTKENFVLKLNDILYIRHQNYKNAYLKCLDST